MEAKRAKTGLTPEERQLYEHNLSKFKGIWERFSTQIDERDAIQKKTFTKWVNKHLKKANRHVDDLFTDLQDGLNLISLLEVLSGEHLHREKGRMRFHALQNVELVLNFLRYKKIKLVNIRPEDIVDGNPKLTLGLIWTIILHFQISDIVLSQREENVSPKEVLLKWAKKSTARYPEVRVSDFTSSWRDGLAFNALIHRNRPDLFEWRTVKTKTVRDRLEHAFYNAEKVGVTRLLDPEDVDTHEIDEKSIITYISSLYDVFPEPPAKHPLFDNESQTLTQEYREVASSLHLWIRENTSIFSERTLPATLNDLVKASQESSRFKTYELPSKQPERQRLTHLYTELQKIYESTGQVDIEPELHIDVLDRNYQKLLSIHQERDQQLQDEIKKFERLDRLADRLSRDCKRVDSRLDDVETRVSEESKRLERLHPLDAKRNAESLESEMRSIEETINSLFQDLNILKTVGHSASSSLDRKVNKLHQKWVALRSSLHSKLIARLASVSFPVVEERTVTRQTRTVLETRLVDTNHHFRSLQQAIEWCKAKIKLINESELGNDLAGVKIELAHHEREHKEIDRFKTTVEQCAAAKTQFTGEEHALYLQHLNNLHKVYSELLTTSNKRMSDLESLLDYLQSLQNQLQWLSDKEAIEVARDWSDPNINLMSVQHYHDNLMSELEKREVSVRSVLERGNSLVLQNHPAGKTISRWTELLKEAWSRLLQFSLACEIHTEATRKYQEYTKDLREAEAWLQSRDELLNTVYSASEFSLDEGERLLKGMQEMREELNKKAPLFAELTARAAKIPPIRQRRLPVTRPIQVTAVCNYTSDKVYIEKEDTWLLHDNSALTQWRVSSLSSRGEDTNVPGVVFFIPPPGKELLESAERLNRAFESTTQLWQKKHMRLRQNMIFATIRVVRSWDLAQFISMGADQRNAIRRALNEDADKLLSEGDPSDPQLRRLRREMDEVNRLFEELERRARQEDEQKVALREFTETSNRIQLSLDEYERTLNSRILNSIARDPHTLERLILQHHDFEKDLKSFTPEIENIQTLYNALARKSHQHTLKVESLLQQWNTIWNYSHLYTERLKCVEIVLASLDEARNVVSELEIKLASFGELPSELETLKDLQDDLVRLQNAIAARQPVVDQLIDDATNTRRVVVRSRDRTSEREHGDLDRLDEDVNSVTRRWNDLCANLVDRLRSCDAAGQLLDNFGQSYQTEIKFIDESYKQLNDLPPVSHAKHHIEPTKVLFTSIVERTQPLEQVNIDGGRFIREAKIYGVTLRRYADEVTKLNPSFERPEYESVQISNVEEKLDNINQRFLTLVTVMQDRIRQMAALTGEEDLQEFVRTMKPAQLRTFRTVFSIAETTKEITNRWLPDETDMGNQINGRETSTSDLLSLKGIKDPSTGRILTVSEAIRERILDVRNGTVRLPSGESIPLASAAEYVDPVIIKKLLSHHSGSTLLEKIQNEIYSAENPVSLTDFVYWRLYSDHKILDRNSGTFITLEDAIKNNILYPFTHEIYTQNKKLTLQDGLIYGFDIENVEKPLSLKECYDLNMLKDDFISTRFGPLSVQEALNQHILDGDQNTIFDPNTKKYINLKKALQINLIKNNLYDSQSLLKSAESGKFVSLKTQSVFNLEFVYYDNEFKSLSWLHHNKVFNNGTFMINNKSTLEDLEGLNLIKKDVKNILSQKIGVFSCGKELNAYEAVCLGLLDPTTGLLIHKNKKIGFSEALKMKIISKQGLENLKSILFINLTFKNKVKYEKFDKLIELLSPPEKGFRLKEVVDKELIKNGLFTVPGSDREVSLEECLKLGIIDNTSASILYKNKEYSLKKALDKKIIRNNLIDDRSLEENIKMKKVIFDVDFSRGLYIDQNGPMTLLKAIEKGFLDKNFVVVKDTKKRKFLKFMEAYNKGVVDERGNVLSDRLYNLKESVENNLAYFDQISLIDAVEYGLYNPTTGLITDPFSDQIGLNRPRLDLSAAFATGLVSTSTTLFRDKNDIVNIPSAIQSGLLDTMDGKYKTEDGPIDLFKANNKGYLVRSQSRQAMEEKYKLCDDSLRQLLEWMGEVEDRLARQEPASENLDGIRDQLNHLKLIKEELESQQRIVQSCLDDVRNVITNGQEYLSRDELMTLERSAKSLKTRYDRSNSTCDRLLRRLQSAYEELSKFRTEANTFADWLGKTKRVLNEKEKNLKNDNVTELLNDIISHQADLRFITMASQKFADESKEFLNNINEYRNTLASRPGLVEPYPSELKKFVAELTREYKELSSRIKDLSDKISGLGGRQREYKLALERVRTWMQNAEPRANKILSEPLAADPHSLDEQLARAKSINAEFQGQGRLFDHLKQSLELLLRSIEGQASRSEMHELAQPVEELTSKYEMISNSIAKRIENLDNALAQSQGVEQSLENVVSWLSNAENNIKSLTRPASLNKARLEEQVRSVRGPLTEIVAYRGTIENVVVLARNLVSSSTNPRLATRIEAKVKDVLSRYEKLLERSTKLSENFNEVTAALDEFMQHANEIETWLQESMDGLAVGGAGAIDVVSVERDAKREPIERVLREGRNLLARKDVTDTSQIRDRMKNIETQWRDLNMLLDEKVRLSKMRAEQSLAYDKLRDHIIAWLNSFEGKIARLEPVALQMELIKKQTEDLKPLVKEHREFAPTIDRLFDLGTSLESVERPESPTRRRSSVSPVKRLSSIGRKSSQEMTSPTPTKIYVTSPMSPVSSGFGSRRSSQEVYHGEDYTGVQQEVAELNNRYSSLGVKLAERSAELDSVREELRKSLENLRSLDTFLERTSRSMPRDGLCANRDEAEKTNKLVKSLLEEMYEKQSLLDSTKNTINELLKRKNGADLKKQLDDVCAKWKSLYDACKNRIEILDSLKDFYDTHDHLSTWLGAKERMIGALGPISSDPRMVQSQVEQVQVLREELRAMRPQLSHLEIITGTLVQKTKWTPLEAKLKNISDRWTSLAQKLDERASNLGAAVDSSREFDSGLNRLRETLNNISDQIDAAANEKDHEQHLRKIQSCERQLEGARQLLAEAEAAGEELCKVLTDAASRAEIQAKLAAVNKQYNALQAKLDRRKAEIENFLKDAREFDATLAKTSGWINDELGSLNDRLLISAHKDILQQQYDFHEPIYKDVINREHQVVMLFDKASSSKRNLENLRSAWDKLKKEISDRHARLSTSLQHCKKFYANLDSFVPWLATSEARLESLRPESFSRRDLDKHLRDLTSFRNDIWKKSGEFEHLRSTGETFVASCDIDKDIVLQEIASAKNRWDRLNNDLLLKTSTLEELGRRLADASDRLRSLTHSVQRCEDRLGSHDSISTQSDPATIARLNALRDEVQSLRKPHEQLRGLCSELDDQVSEVSNGRTSGLKDEVDGLADRLDDLSSRLQDRCDRAQLAAKAAQNYYDKIKNLTVDLTNLEDEFHQMKPPGRDLKVLKGQQDELGMFNNKLNRAGDEVSTIQALSENLDSEGARQQAENIAKRLSSLESASRRREESLENALDKLYDFLNKAKTADELLNRALDDYKKLKPVGSEPDTIRSQQDESASLRANIVDPAGSAVESALSSGQILVQTANPGVNTAQVERECDRISQKWNDLKEKMTDRDKRLNVGLLQSGKFQEALEGLSKWLADMEDLVANQKPPSADFKVVKAQLQEQKFLKKMLLDRQGSINSLFVMGREVASNCGPSEGNAIERQLKNLSDRFEDLNTKADSRMNALEKAMNIARLFQDKITSLSDWLFKTEKKIKDMHTVPTDEEKIQNKIREHESLHSEIMRRKSEFNEVTDIAANLASLVSEDDATLVADQVQEAIDRYSKLVNDSENVSHILESARQKLRHLVVTYQQLQGWMENMESRLARFKVLAVHTEQLYAQMEDLADLSEEISNQQNNVDSTIDSGHELMRSISSDEAIQLKDKLDSLQRRYNDLTTRGAELLKQAQEALPLVQQFHNSHNKLVDWMHSAETTLQNAEPREESIHALEMDIQEFRPVLETVNQLGPQLCAIGPGEGAATIEGLVTRDNRRFDAISEQVQRKAERLQLCKQRSLEVLSDVDSLLEWFREVEAQLREAEPPNGDPQVIRLQLKEHKALNDDIASQKGRVRDVLDTAKKVLRESPQYEDNSVMRDKMVDLRETMDNVWKASGDRLNLLELALGLAQHFETSHSELAAWLDEKTSEAKNLRPSSLRPQALMQDQVVTQRLLQSITEHKPLMDKLNKTGESLIKIVSYEEGVKIQDVLDNDNARYNELRNLLKQRQEALEKALQESSEFADKLEGMLRALSNAADEMNSAEPVSAHPPKIRQQIKENQGLIDDIGKREEAFEAVKKAAGDVIAKSPNDPAVKDIKKKLEKLQQLWKEVNDATKSRNKSLSQALEVAAKFWAALESVMTTLAEIERTLMEQEPPALKPELVRRQGEALGLVKNEIDSAKPRVEDVRKTGQSLMALCGDADKTEVRKNIEDLDSAWDTVTTLFARREENLLDAMERAMEFHETLRALKEFLQDAERRFAALGPLGEDIGTIRNQMKEVKDLKASLDPMMIKVESLNRQAAELTERSTADQAMGLKESLTSVNNRWDELHRGIAERYRQLENALLRLGQFQTALSELLTWIANTEKTLDTEMSVVAVDPHLLEVQLAKLKVLMNDMSAHQNSVDTLNDAGRQIVEENPTDDKTQDRLKDLNKKWKNLITKASEKQSELEEALRQGQRFSAEIQDLLAYLGEVDSVIASSKPVGGLPETASEQLERFMIVYNELEETRPRIESAISHGNDLIRKNPDSSSYTQNNLKTLKSRWDNVISRANDKKIKLEIALKEAVEFHDALQAFVNWLTSAEKTLSSLKPVSRVLETILNQIEDHKNFQKEVGVHRETMLNLDKKGNHLKYFSQKQDVILIKNLLISVQHRWEKVVSKSAERTRSLDHGYKEAKDFHDSWSNLINFLKETDQKLDDIETSNDPVKLRQKLTKHREIQKSLTGKQIIYDATLRQGKNLKEKAPKSDENTLKMMLQELKDMWTSVNNKVLLKQRNLEESLLYCGQVKDALDALLDFLKKANKELADDVVHGDLDTVQGLIERHRSLEQDIQNRRSQIESLERSELLSEQISELSELWKKTNVLCQKKNVKLQSALKMAEELHKNVHNLLEFLSDSESKLRNWELSDDETELRVALQEHERFLDEIKDKERDKNMTIRLAEEILSKAHPDAVNTIKHWISIIQSRWEEITSWSRQKTERLKTHLRSLQDMDSLLEELLAYLGEKESNLISLEHQELPKTSVETNILIEEHQRFMESMAKRTTEIDVVIKAKTIKERKQSKKSGSTQEINEITRRQSLRSSREQLAERRMSRSSGKDYSDPTLPHFGPKFPTKGSKTPEPQFKCARSRLLYDRWRSVWLMSWERQRRLRDHLLHLGELERLANFSWDEWRKRFLRFMNHKKSRLTDLFRKMDKNNDNLIPRDDFVNGIINTKFDTNRPEMGAVADMFDHNSEGYIDWKEFIAALRPDWEERQPSTEAEKIHDEVKRLVMLCTCRQKFRVFQVGEGKYRFGDSQKLRLVRILRSTVMVRVGGGWQALEEFLVKNDPCRVEMLPIPNPFIPEEHEAWCPLSVKRPSKGRTNIELREQFILPEGVSQSMSAFKPKLSTEKKSSSPLPTAGPITKIREKSSKSVPMASSRGTPGSVDSLSDLDSPHTPGYMMPRKSSMRVPSSSTPGSLPGSRSNSRPQSRTNSKPPSRHASNLSLASSDDGTPSRIPRMSVPSRSSSSASGTQRKLTAPGALNGSKSPSGRSSTSKIPVFVGSTDVSHSTSSSGTPSGRTTPKSSR